MLNEKVCSFCGKGPSKDLKLIASTIDNSYICEQCVKISESLIEESKKEDKKKFSPKYLSPKNIFDKLSEYVIGQESAKKTLSIGISNHYKRIKFNATSGKDVKIEKSNILLSGPTGCGKTYLAETAAKIIGVPYCIVDATSITETGYVGEDVESILASLLESADGDKEKAENGIVYIDEIDKISKKKESLHHSKDPSGEGVQQALLKLIEGKKVNVSLSKNKLSPFKEYIEIDTKNILFIAGGAFSGIEKIKASRLKSKSGIGFSKKENEAKENINSNDFIEYGLVPEFLARFPIMVECDALTETDLINILSKPKNALLHQYEALLSIDDKIVKWNQDGLISTAKKALALNSGARGLKSVLENQLEDIFFFDEYKEKSFIIGESGQPLMIESEKKLP